MNRIKKIIEKYELLEALPICGSIFGCTIPLWVVYFSLHDEMSNNVREVFHAMGFFFGVLIISPLLFNIIMLYDEK